MKESLKLFEFMPPCLAMLVKNSSKQYYFVTIIHANGYS